MTGSDGSATGFGYDGNGNQVTKVERPAGGAARTWTYGYDLDDRLVNVSNHSEVPAPTQWASGATASSSLLPNGAAAATGAPDTSVCGSTATAWAPMPMPWSGSEWLQASYATPTRAKGVRLHETLGAPFVKQVELVEPGGAKHTVWTGQDATACGGWLNVDFDGTSYPVAGVKVTTAASMNLGLDAVGLDPVPAAGPETQVAAYQYDANGLRVRRVDSGGDRAFLLDGLSIVAEYSEPGVREAWYTQSLARIDEPLNVVTGQGKYWYQADALGSIYTLTTSTGAVQARGGYDVFGEPVAEGGAAVGQRFGFTGREHEVDSGLTYHRDRYMQAALGRWTQQDRAGWVDGPALYAYARGNPVAHMDWSGRATFAVLALLLKDAIAAEEVFLEDGAPNPVQDSIAIPDLDVMLLQGLMDLSAGIGDTILLGQGPKLRRLFGEDCVDYNSGAYAAGVVVGTVIQTVVLGAVLAEVEVAAQFNLTKGANWLTDYVARWGRGSFKVGKTWFTDAWHFHLGPGEQLMRLHLPQQFQQWSHEVWPAMRYMLKRLF